jgi:hypothetical protein
MNKNTTVPSSSRTIKERGKIDVYNTQIHDQSLSCLATCTSMKMGGGGKKGCMAQGSHHGEMMRSGKLFPQCQLNDNPHI